MNKSLSVVLSIILAIALLLGLCFAYASGTPMYTLMRAEHAMRADGVDGLMPYLTPDMQDTVSFAVGVVDNPLVGSVMDIFGEHDYLEQIAAHLSSIQWEPNDVMEGRDSCIVLLDFVYPETFSGTMEVSLVRNGHGWLIDGLSPKSFDLM